MTEDAVLRVNGMSGRTPLIFKCFLYCGAAAVFLLAGIEASSAQAAGNRYIRKGNKLYEKQDLPMRK